MQGNNKQNNFRDTYTCHEATMNKLLQKQRLRHGTEKYKSSQEESFLGVLLLGGEDDLLYQ